MRKLLVGLTILATIGMFAVTASADPPAGGPPGQGECEHGNSGQECKPDPQPDHGQDCEEHGPNEGGVNEDHCLSPTPPPTTVPPSSPPPTTEPPTTEPPTSPPPTTEPPTTTVPPTQPPATTPPPRACPGSIEHGAWYGDPRIDLTLTGEGSFVVRGGVQRFSGLHVIRAELDCREVLEVNRYKIHRGSYVRVVLDGELVLRLRAPRVG